MNLYLVYRTNSIGYNSYDSFVVYAETEEEAINYVPYCFGNARINTWGIDKSYGDWTYNKEHVKATLLTDKPHMIQPSGTIVIASFNAG